jgi:membrane protease YdiL (CAAX protease family)
MILRSLLHLDPLAIIRHKYHPLNAFTTDLPAGISPGDSAGLAREGSAWSTVFSKSASPGQYDQAARVISGSRNVRWWKWPALVVVYTASGDLSQANEYAKKAQSDALFPLLTFGALGLVRLGLGLLGAVILLIGIVAGVQRFQGRKVPYFCGIWNIAPEPVAPSQRRLSSDDLLIVFVIYLIVSELLSLLLGGFSGFGPKHALSFGGALTPFLPQLESMSEQRRAVIASALEAAAYIFSALPSFGVLVCLAKKRGASLSEVGWTRVDRGKNVLYGIGGFAISTPVLIVVSLIADQAFKRAPDPSNPVIPELVFATSAVVVVVLITLAVICAPVVEEMLFRGALYNGIKLRLGVWPAIMLSGLVFGCIHPVGIAEKLALSSLGMVFAWMAETRKSLVPSMTAHALNNGMSTLFLMLLMKG